MGVVDADAPIDEKNRQHDRDRRQEALRQHPEREMLAAGVVAREAVGHQRAEQRREHRRRARHDDRVDQPFEPAIGEERRLVVDQRRRARPPHRRDGEVVVARLDRGVEHPVERHQDEHEEEAEQQDAGERDPPSRPPANGGLLRPSCLLHPEQPADEEGHDQRGDDQEQPASGRRLAEVELGEADRVEIVGGGVVCVPGPPPVMMKMVSNRRIASSSRKVMASRIIGASSGRVIDRNTCHTPPRPVPPPRRGWAELTSARRAG